MLSKLQKRLRERESHNLMRQRLTNESAQSVMIKINGKDFLNFSSNDYLGLANHPKMIESMTRAAKKYGVGSGASHLVAGHSSEHHQLELELAEFLGVEKTVLFSTGYMANLGVLTSLFDKKDYLIQDKLNHASLIDGGLASDATMIRYAHNDVASLERQLAQKAETKMIVTDGVFSMDGDLAPLDKIVALKEKNNTKLMVDDAHGFGVLGPKGRGTLEHFSLEPSTCDIYMATLSKAVGGFGAFVAGSNVLIESLIQFARSYIYTTAMPPALATANRMGLQLVKNETERRENLNYNIKYFRAYANEKNIPLSDSLTAIQPVILGRNSLVEKVSEQLKKSGILVVAIRPPTVPVNTARLRITINAEHNKDQLERLVDTLAEILKAEALEKLNQELDDNRDTLQ